MGTFLPKQFLELAGLPVLVHTLKAVAAVEDIVEIILVAPPDYRAQIEELIDRYQLTKVKAVVRGGRLRQ